MAVEANRSEAMYFEVEYTKPALPLHRPDFSTRRTIQHVAQHHAVLSAFKPKEPLPPIPQPDAPVADAPVATEVSSTHETPVYQPAGYLSTLLKPLRGDTEELPTPSEVDMAASLAVEANGRWALHG